MTMVKEGNVHVEDPSVVTIDGAKLALDPGESAVVVDGHIISRVLQLGDEYEPHVDDEVGSAVKEGDGRSTELVGEEGEERNCQAKANIRENNVRTLFLGEERRPGGEMVDGLLGDLPLLVGGDVLDEVEDPTSSQVLKDGEGHVELGPRHLSGFNHFAISRRDMNLILAHMVGVQVVTVFRGIRRVSEGFLGVKK